MDLWKILLTATLRLNCNWDFDKLHNIVNNHCFGCHAGSKQVTNSSDHIAFLMSLFKLSFPQAVMKLAEITNTPLPNQEKSPATTTEKS